MRYTQIFIMSVLKSRGSYTSIASIGALVKILKYICSFQREDQTRKEDRNAARRDATTHTKLPILRQLLSLNCGN